MRSLVKPRELYNRFCTISCRMWVKRNEKRLVQIPSIYVYIVRCGAGADVAFVKHLESVIIRFLVFVGGTDESCKLSRFQNISAGVLDS